MVILFHHWSCNGGYGKIKLSLNIKKAVYFSFWQLEYIEPIDIHIARTGSESEENQGTGDPCFHPEGQCGYCEGL